jgi:hypothetical protein
MKTIVERVLELPENLFSAVPILQPPREEKVPTGEKGDHLAREQSKSSTDARISTGNTPT